MKKAVVTGGAGFIGSHVVDHLLSLNYDKVVVLDDLRTGQELFVKQHEKNERFEFVHGDLQNLEIVKESVKGASLVVHFQANADVRGGIKHRRLDLEQNTITTWNVGEACAEAGVKDLLFASSATVYGEPDIFPTPESVTNLQTSLYGASKMCGEAILQAYSEYVGFNLRVFRFVSWTGPRYSHGVIYDFFKKLRANPQALEILGDGKQRKSYLDVRDGIAGIFTALDKEEKRSEVYNLGHDDFMPVTELASIVVDEMGLEGVKFEFTGGSRGWVGDSPIVHLDTQKIKALGWAPSVSIEQSIRDTVSYLTKNENLIIR